MKIEVKGNQLISTVSRDSISQEYEKIGWSNLDKSGKLEKLKQHNFELFKKMFKDQFGTDYKGK